MLLPLLLAQNNESKESTANAVTTNATTNAKKSILATDAASPVTFYVAATVTDSTTNVTTHAFACVSTTITAVITIVIGGSDQPLSFEKRGVGECDEPLIGDCITPFAHGASLNQHAKTNIYPPAR